MKNKKFDAMMEEVGLRVVGKSAYGMIGDFPVVATINQQSGIQVTFTLEDALPAGIKKDLKRAVKKYAVVTYIGKEHMLAIVANQPKKFAERYQGMSAAVVAVFAENNVRPVDVCPYCKQAGCDVIAQHKTGYQAVHNACLRNEQDKIKAAAEDNLNNGSYLLGIIGAVIGGLLACIPSVLSTLWAETAYAILYALIPLGIYYGYKLFKGKMDRVALVVTIVLSLFFALMVDVLTVIAFMVSEGLPLNLLILLIVDKEFLIDFFVRDGLISLVFTGLGVFWTWGQISKTSYTAVARTEETLASVIPLKTTPEAAMALDTATEETPIL